jgi:hypothetical protein
MLAIFRWGTVRLSISADYPIEFGAIRLLVTADRAPYALMQDLEARGTLDSTLILNLTGLKKSLAGAGVPM